MLESSWPAQILEERLGIVRIQLASQVRLLPESTALDYERERSEQ